MSSFHELREIVTKTVPFVGNHTGRVLMNGIATAETYIRYRQNLLLSEMFLQSSILHSLFNLDLTFATT